MADAKRQLELVPADTLTQAVETTSPMVATAAVRLMARLSDRITLPVNVVISNVPGPRDALYFSGAKLDHYIPVSTISNGVGLNITVHSYEDKLDFGLVADRDLVPDIWDLVDLHIDEIDRLFEASGAEWAEPPRPPAGRHGGPTGSITPSRRSTNGGAGTTTAKKPGRKKTTAKKPGRKKPANKKSANKKPAKKNAVAT
jgi:hypothetical protein